MEPPPKQEEDFLRRAATETFVRGLLSIVIDDAYDAFFDCYHDESHQTAVTSPCHSPTANLSFYSLLQDCCVPVVDLEDHPDTNSVIVQIRSHTQHEHRSCGYRALHNCVSSALAMHHLHEGGTTSHVKQHARRLHCSAHFWVSHRRYKAALQQRVRDLRATAAVDELSYFWTEKTVNDDVMERIYLEHLLNHDQLLQNLGGAEMFSSFSEFGYSTLRFNRLHFPYVRKLERVFEQFRARERYKHAFIVGQTNHWVAMIAYKYGTRIELFYIDSTNRHPVLRGSEADFQRIADEIIQRRRFFRPELVNQPAQERWYRTQDLDCLRGCHYTVRLLHDCLVGRTTPLATLVRMNFEGFLETWHRCMDGALEKQKEQREDEANESFLGALSNEWIANYFPPPVFEKNVKAVLEEVGTGAFPGDLARRLSSEFLRPMRVATRDFTAPESLSRLFESLKWIAEFLDPLVGSQTS